MSAPGDGPGSGSADELNALLTTLTQWAQRAMPAPPSGHAGPECEWCPLCQLASALRGEHPELTDRLAEAGAAVAGAARALLDSATRTAPGSGADSAPDSAPGSAAGSAPAGSAPAGSAPAGSAPATAARSRPRPRIEHVVLDDAPGSD